MSAIEVGQQLPELRVRFTRASLVRYAGASTDFNPIHYSDRFAAALGLPSVIAHGMLTMGTALRVVTDWCGDPAKVVSYYVRFTRPVAVPDTDEGVEVVFSGVVKSVVDNVATIALDAVFEDAKVLGSAAVEVRVD